MPYPSGVASLPFVDRTRAAWLGLVAMLALVAPAPCAASDERRLVVLVDPGAPTLARRLREEVEALGLEVRSVPAVEPDLTLEEHARSTGAVAAIRIAPSGNDAVEMTIVDRATGKTVQRRLAIRTPTDPASAELIATRTVELLRASLMELAASHPTRGDVSVPPEIVDSVTPVHPGATRYSFGLGPVVVVGPPTPAVVNGWLSFTLRAESGFGVGVAWVAPLGSADLRVPEGTVLISLSEYRLASVYETEASRLGLSVRALAGAMLVHLALDGEASAPFVGDDIEIVAGGPWLGSELRLGVTESVHALVRGDAALTFPRVVIRSAGREVATWSRVIGSAALGLELEW